MNRLSAFLLLSVLMTLPQKSQATLNVLIESIDVTVCNGGTNLSFNFQGLSPDSSGNFNTIWQNNGPAVLAVAGNVTSTTLTATLACVSGAGSGGVSATWNPNSNQYKGAYTFTSITVDQNGNPVTTTQTGQILAIPSGENHSQLQVGIFPSIDVTVCNGGTNLSFNFQGLSPDSSGNFNTIWQHNGPAVLAVVGNITSAALTATLACVSGAGSGGISAPWTGTQYQGTYTFTSTTVDQNGNPVSTTQNGVLIAVPDGGQVCQVSSTPSAVCLMAIVQGTPNTATIEMKPSLFTFLGSGSDPAPYPIGAQVEPITIECQDQSGNTVPNCAIDFDFDVIEGSGGHVHNTNRPTGDFGSDQCSVPFAQHVSCNTGTPGAAVLVFSAPEASGTTTTANGTVSANGLSNTFSFTINVQYDGLILANGPGLFIHKDSLMHDNNNGWVTPSTNFALNVAASLFDLNLTSLGYTKIPNIEITATSLPLGGLFDYSIEWQPPHIAHRFGNNADVGMSGLTPQHRKALAWAVDKAGFRTPVPGERPSDFENHWHLVGPH
jgi:hypothetical protein